MSDNLALPLHEHGQRAPARTALVVGASTLGYGELAGLSSRLARELLNVRRTGRVGILASRSLAACAGILGTSWAGGTYVPLHLKLPEERLLALLARLELDALVADARGAALLTPRVRAALPRLLILADDAPPCAQESGLCVRRLAELVEPGPARPLELAGEHVAYIEFTSGTTGQPKGVMVPTRAVNHYLAVVQAWFGLSADDRAAGTSDITFDLSVHDLFLTWLAGAELHVLAPLDMLAPARFLRARRLTTWLSVPSIIALMRQARVLAPGIFPSLRLSCFCGEPLPLAAAQAWAAAAPNSTLENLYGPTEATVACLRQPFGPSPVVTPQREIIAIGQPFPGTAARVVDGELRPVPDGTPGELLLGGAQLALGYLDAPALTLERFPELDGQRWYRSGDSAVRDAAGAFHHLGRLDHQVKVLGQRVELEEVEAHLRAAAGSELVAAVAWPSAHGSASGLVGFMADAQGTPAEVRAALQRSLPAYMVPARLVALDELPLNTNGKIDRRALLARLEEGSL